MPKQSPPFCAKMRPSEHVESIYYDDVPVTFGCKLGVFELPICGANHGNSRQA